MPRMPDTGGVRVAEFFAGIGLVRLAVERLGWRVVFANDIEPFKARMYEANFGGGDFRLGDIREIAGEDVPDADLATASFPCTDLSLAGLRRGLDGEQSGMFWEFARVLGEMGGRRPRAVLLENVPSFASSRGGEDFRAALRRLSELGYEGEAVRVDARHFVPQSRERLFVCARRPGGGARAGWRPAAGERAPAAAPEAPAPPPLDDLLDDLPPGAPQWWDGPRAQRLADSLSPAQRARFDARRADDRIGWSTAYRRTRGGRAVWELRRDRISGCLRTARGGSSRQALVRAGRGGFRVRWMTPREYARLQGAPAFAIPGAVTENQALSGFGDAVCVPAVEWVARRYLAPALGARAAAPAAQDAAP